MVEEIIKQNDEIFLQKTLLNVSGLSPENP